jgi:hypothetical protein
MTSCPSLLSLLNAQQCLEQLKLVFDTHTVCDSALLEQH